MELILSIVRFKLGGAPKASKRRLTIAASREHDAEIAPSGRVLWVHLDRTRREPHVLCAGSGAESFHLPTKAIECTTLCSVYLLLRQMESERLVERSDCLVEMTRLEKANTCIMQASALARIATTRFGTCFVPPEVAQPLNVARSNAGNLKSGWQFKVGLLCKPTSLIRPSPSSAAAEFR